MTLLDIIMIALASGLALWYLGLTAYRIYQWTQAIDPPPKLKDGEGADFVPSGSSMTGGGKIEPLHQQRSKRAWFALHKRRIAFVRQNSDDQNKDDFQ